MEVNTILQIAGIIYLSLWLGILFNSKYYLKTFNEMVDSRTYMFFGWFLAIILGYVLITYYNAYFLSKEGLVEIIWWISLFKWITLLIFPKFFKKIAKVFVDKSYISFLWFIVVLLWLAISYLWFYA